jgi:hypothetical protein
MFRIAQIVCWMLPGAIAGLSWGPAVGLVAFGAQMFTQQPATRIYIAYRARQGAVDIADAQRFNLMINLVAGSLYGYLARWLLGPLPLASGG